MAERRFRDRDDDDDDFRNRKSHRHRGNRQSESEAGFDTNSTNNTNNMGGVGFMQGQRFEDRPRSYNNDGGQRPYNNGPRPAYSNNQRPGGAPPRQFNGPRFVPTVSHEPEEVTVKWFQQEKGYGFVMDANNRDLFIHISVVKAAGRETVEPNEKLLVQRGPSRKGGDAVNIILNDMSAALPIGSEIRPVFRREETAAPA